MPVTFVTVRTLYADIRGFGPQAETALNLARRLISLIEAGEHVTRLDVRLAAC